MGPNDGKTYLEQITCIARALMSYTPKGFYDPAIFVNHLHETAHKHGGLKKKWIRFAIDNVEAFGYSGAEGEGGKSETELPAGVEPVSTFRTTLEKTEFVQRFEKTILNLETRLSPNDIRLRNLKKTVEACNPDFNANEIVRFRNWLQTFPNSTFNIESRVFIYCDIERLNHFIRYLAEERSAYCIDAFLFGSVLMIGEICNYCSKKAEQESTEEIPGMAGFKIFNKLVANLTSSPNSDPATLLRYTVQAAFKEGFVEELFDIVSSYRDRYSSIIEDALNSKTLDQSLDMLYKAIPVALGVYLVLDQLSKNTDHLDANKTRLVNGALSIVDEDIVRLMTNPFRLQVLDLNGQYWKWMKEDIERIKREKGIEAARKIVHKSVEQELIYPRALIPMLLNEEEG